MVHTLSIDGSRWSRFADHLPVFVLATATRHSFPGESNQGQRQPRVLAPAIDSLLLSPVKSQRTPFVCKPKNLLVRSARQFCKVEAESGGQLLWRGRLAMASLIQGVPSPGQITIPEGCLERYR